MIDPGKARRSINFLDEICYSHVTDLEGQPLDLCLSLMVQNGNSEMRLADGRDDEVSTGVQPLIVWLNGNGWRKCQRNMMTAEIQFLAEAGYAVAFPEYRHSGVGHFPAQLQDVKTAVRFLRAHAAEYGIDPTRVGVAGRSAGGHLTAWMAMNTDGFDTDEYADQSSKIQAALDMFGPADLPPCTKENLRRIKTDPGYRWHSLKETHEGAMLGVTDATAEDEAYAMGRMASPIYAINDGMCPLTILHGTQDPLVPCKISEDFYDTLVAAGQGDKVDLYLLKDAGHGTREFFQPESKEIIREFFDKYLK